jgi:hypothetical protein
MFSSVGKKIGNVMTHTVAFDEGLTIVIEKVKGGAWRIREGAGLNRGMLQEMDDLVVLYSDLFANGLEQFKDQMVDRFQHLGLIQEGGYLKARPDFNDIPTAI